MVIASADDFLKRRFSSSVSVRTELGLTPLEKEEIKSFLESNIRSPSPIPANPVFLKFLEHNLPDGKKIEDESGRILFSTTEPEYEIRCDVVYFNHPGFAHIVMLLNRIFQSKIVTEYSTRVPRLTFELDYIGNKHASNVRR